MYVQPALSPIIPSQVHVNPSITECPPWKHSLTVLSIKRVAKNTVEVRVSSNKATGGNIYYYWYVDGDHMATTRSPVFTFNALDTGPLQIDVLDHTDPGMDTEAEAPQAFPGRRTVYWNPPKDTDIKEYRIRTRKNAGDWTVIGTVPHEHGKWNYYLLTPVLDDLASYEIDVAALDTAGNVGSTVATESFNVLRVPDAEDYDAAYSDVTNKFTFAST